MIAVMVLPVSVVGRGCSSLGPVDGRIASSEIIAPIGDNVGSHRNENVFLFWADG